jgi:hypothetical protein
MNPLRIVDGKLKVQAPTLLSTVSLLRWSIITPLSKNIANNINDVFHLRNTTEFYNSWMNMLKSSSFNLDPGKDYNIVDFTRKSAVLAPDLAEFLIPMWQIAKVQTWLWKWTISAQKAVKESRFIAKVMTNAISKYEKVKVASQWAEVAASWVKLMEKIWT